MKFSLQLIVLCAGWFALTRPAAAQVNITTWQVNLQHTGNNASETILTPGKISSPGNFGLLFSQPMDGQTYGQPLLVSGVSVGGTAHNVVYAATEHGSLYAFDADNNTGTNAAPLWQAALLPTGTVPVPQSVVGSGDISVELGITTTPAIDPASGTIYIVSKVQRTADTTYHQFLYALDLATGAPKFGSPVEINPSFGGTSKPDAVGNVVPFNALREHLRCAMILHNGVVYLAYASHSDTNPYHGEIIGYDATTLALVKTFIATPNGTNPEAGIWQSGAGPAVDGDGNMFVSIGNGAWDQKSSNLGFGTDWGQSVLKLPTTGTFNVSYANPLNWFTPNNWATLNNGDLDLGSGGLLLLPDQAGPHPHIMVGGGKGAVLYVLDRDNLGGLNTPDNAIQEIPEPGGNWFFTTPAYFNGYLYYSAAGGPLQQRAVGYNAVDGSYVSPTTVSSTDVFNNKGSGCFISSDGTKNGLVWMLTGGGFRVYDATNVAGSPILSANATIPGNITCQNTKFSLPIVANGKLYYTGYEGNSNTGHLLVYGLLPTAVGTPAAASDAAATATSSTTVTVNWTSHSTNESGFKIKRSTSRTGNFALVGTAGAGVTVYADTGRSPSTTYYYQVVATNANGDANASNVAAATTFPSYAENGLVAFWPLDETGGATVADVTANGHPGTINGEAGIVAGFINNGVGLHGTGQATSNIVVTDKSDLQFTVGQSFTLSAWVFASALRGSEETIIAKSRDAGNYYGIWINAANRWVFRGPGGDVVGGAVTEGVWTHVATVQNGAANTRALYVNGVLAASGAAQAADGTGALWMGQQKITGNFASFPGTLDEVRLYNRALAAGEIASLLGAPVLEAHSGQTQGTAGNYGVTLWPTPAAKVEPRKGAVAGQYNVVLNFSAPVSGVTASLTRADGLPVGGAGAVSYDATGRVVTVALNGVGNAQLLNLHLAGILPGNGTADIPFSVLWGDVNADNVVNALDSSIVQNTHTTIVNAASAFSDVNCDGAINAADDSQVAAGVGNSLGPQTPTNLAIFQPTTSSPLNGNNAAAFAVDTDLTTRWESEHGVDPEYMYVYLGGTCKLQSVKLYWENAAGKNYTVDVSDDASAWSNVQTVTGNTTVNSYLTYPANNATGRYVRMNGTARTGPYGYSLYDFQVIGLSTVANTYAPTVNSVATVYATKDTAFSYRITGTNAPTGYNASGLPAGLTVDPATGIISGTPTQLGTTQATVSATNATGTRSTPLAIVVQTAFGTWKSSNFTAAEANNAAVSGATAAPAGDGITNLVKYALNLNPKTSGATGLPVQSMTTLNSQKYLTLTFTRSLTATDATCAAEVSGDLLTWNAGSGGVATTATTNPDGKTQTVVARDLTPMTDTGKRFIHLKVTMP